MASTTPVYKLPYPVGTDRVMDGDDVIAGLANKLDATLAYAGILNLTANIAQQLVDVTLPAGRYAVAPAIATSQSGYPDQMSHAITSINPGNFRIYYKAPANGTAMAVRWIALAVPT
jgi:hypothetical protein